MQDLYLDCRFSAEGQDAGRGRAYIAPSRTGGQLNQSVTPPRLYTLHADSPDSWQGGIVSSQVCQPHTPTHQLKQGHRPEMLHL